LDRVVNLAGATGASGPVELRATAWGEAAEASKQWGATLGTGRDWRRRVLLHHAPIAFSSAAALVLLMGLSPFASIGHGDTSLGFDAASLAPGSDSFVSRLTTSTGYVALVLLALTLLIGPANLLLRRRNPVSSYLRRDLGTWTAIFSVVHVIIGFQVRGGGRFGFLDFFVADGRPLTDGFGLGNWTGLAALVIVVGLLVISTNRSMRELKAERWKDLQRLNYSLFVLVVLHAVFYGALGRPGSPFTLLLFSAVVAVLLGQAVGIWLYRRREQDRATAPGAGGSAASPAVLHKVPVSNVRRLTEDSVCIGFDVPDELREEFRFRAGQHITVRSDLGGPGVRRNYSICSPATENELRIAVKRIPGGAFSTFALEQLRPGDVLELMTPTGRFGTDLHPLHSKHHAALAVGSGITPILSLLATVLEVESGSRFTLIYANRTGESTMFRAELDQLAARYPGRLEIIHVRSREPHRDPRRTGRLDRDKLASLVEEVGQADEWFLCGPLELMTLATEVLVAHGTDPEHVHVELFFGYSNGTATPTRDYTMEARLTFRLGGREESIRLAPGDSLLEGALKVRSDAPYACMGGACGTCMAKLVEGSVEMDQDFALGKEDLDRGYILTCRSYPTSAQVAVDYDA
jgi:ferredoxin-NADP reductase/DMSO/TMAO reductase YedYZ heme-binding membrane subunit